MSRGKSDRHIFVGLKENGAESCTGEKNNNG